MRRVTESSFRGTEGNVHARVFSLEGRCAVDDHRPGRRGKAEEEPIITFNKVTSSPEGEVCAEKKHEAGKRGVYMAEQGRGSPRERKTSERKTLIEFPSSSKEGPG